MAAKVLQKLDYTATKPSTDDPKITGWRRPRVYIPGTGVCVDDTRKMFGEYGYIVRWGWFDETLDDVDFVCFPGGADINPKFYGQAMAPETYPDSYRDLQEIAVYHKYANVPKVGICRGLQLLNIMNGGTLIQHVNNHNDKDGHEMKTVWGDTLKTSSVHHQMCVPPVDGAKVLAWADSVAFNRSVEPEAIWYPDTDCFGVQGHPEWGPEELTKFFMIMIKEFILPLTNYKTRFTGPQGIVH